MLVGTRGRAKRRRTTHRVVAATAGTLLTVGGLVATAQPAAAATTAAFLSTAGLLSVIGDNADNTIVISRNAAGAVLVNGGAVAVSGGTPTVANTFLIQVFGQGGNDTLAVNESLGALPSTHLFGATGNDRLTGGSATDRLFGQTGDDVLIGRGGSDLLFGGADDDTLVGGDADDQAFGEKGDDRVIWNPGDDTDVNVGGEGVDTSEVNGGAGAETFRASAEGDRVRFDRLTPAPFSVDIATTEQLVLNAGGGDDRFDTVGALAQLIRLTVDGGAGKDTLLGSDGADLILGGEGDDFVDGQHGSDVGLLGAGADTFRWDPGDGDDVVEGQVGADRMLFNGSGADEKVEITADAGRVRLFRDVAAVTMDLDDTEAVTFNALGGADDVFVGDLSGTDLSEVQADLAGADGVNPDTASDTVTVDGTNGEDRVLVLGSGGGQLISGLSADVLVRHADNPPTDGITVRTIGGPDTVDALPMSPLSRLTVEGGGGDDVLIGSNGDDALFGGDGNDVLVGGPGTDFLDGGRGRDVLVGGELVRNGMVASRAWVARHVVPTGTDAVVDLDGKRITVPKASLRRLR